MHHIGPPTIGTDRQSPANDLAQGGEIGADAQQLLGTAERQSEAGHHLVEDQQRAMLPGQFNQCLQKRRVGTDQSHVPHDRLQDHSRDLFALAMERLFQGGDIVVFQHQGISRTARGNSGAGGGSQRGRGTPRLDQQAVHMPVVAPRELDELVAAGETAGDADRAHRRLGPRVDHPHHFNGGDGVHHRFRQFGLRPGGSAKAGAPLERAADGVEHRGMPMPQNVWTPRPDIVDQPVPIEVVEIRPFPPIHHEGFAPDTAERAGRAVDSPGDDSTGSLEFGVTLGTVHAPGLAFVEKSAEDAIAGPVLRPFSLDHSSHRSGGENDWQSPPSCPHWLTRETSSFCRFCGVASRLPDRLQPTAPVHSVPPPRRFLPTFPGVLPDSSPSLPVP